MTTPRKLTFKERVFGRTDPPPDDEAPGAIPARRTPGPSAPSPLHAVTDDIEPYDDDLEYASTIPRARRENTSTLTPAQLRERRMERIENARVGRHFHEQVMLFCLKCWLLVGPIDFVALTAAEVAYILTHLVAPNDRNGQVIIWAGAMFIELAMMFTTFGVGIKRRDVAEKKEVYGHADPGDERLLTLGTAMWVLFALINILGQTAFLLHVIASSQNAAMNLLYVFVASRVAGFILGDAGTAFFLGQLDTNDIKLMARAERQRGKLYAELADAEGERKITEAEAEAKVQLLEIEVQSKRHDADFLAGLKRQTFTRILEETNTPNAQGALPAPDDDAPLTGEFR